MITEEDVSATKFPLLDRRGNLLADTLSLGLLRQALKPATEKLKSRRSFQKMPSRCTVMAMESFFKRFENPANQ